MDLLGSILKLQLPQLAKNCTERYFCFHFYFHTVICYESCSVVNDFTDSGWQTHSSGLCTQRVTTKFTKQFTIRILPELQQIQTLIWNSDSVFLAFFGQQMQVYFWLDLKDKCTITNDIASIWNSVPLLLPCKFIIVCKHICSSI